MPSKSTTDKALSPVVRINNLDTFEHVTDFESAGDHVITLKKWQELALPISKTIFTGVGLAHGGGRHESVFESTLDNMVKPESPHAKRYRFKGPWLAGQSEAEFDQFLKSVSVQKKEFLKMVRSYLEDKRQAEKERELRAEGEEIENTKPIPLSNEEFNKELRELRVNPRLFGPLINRYFDLATPPEVPNRDLYKANWAAGPSDLSSLEYARNGPPNTHPSAGLSYIRTLSHLDNHPVAGPQQYRRPVHARVLRTKSHVRGTAIKALVGIGGIVAEDSHAFSFSDLGGQGSGLHIDPDIPGGAKYWSRAERAMVSPEGTIRLKVGRAFESTKAVYGVAKAQQPLPEHVKGTNRVVPNLVQ